MTILEFPVDEFAVIDPLQKIELTDAERDVVGLVFADNALLNPVRPSIDKTIASIDREVSLLSSLAGGTGDQVIPEQFGIPAPPGPGGISDTEISALIASLNSLRTEITQYRTHSDRVSGFTLPVGTNPPSFQGLLGVAVAHNLIKNSLEPEGTPEKDFFSFIFETLLGSAEELVDRAFAASFRIFERLNGGLDGRFTLTLSGVTGNFSIGETVDDLTTVKTAVVNAWNPATNTLVIIQTDPGDFNVTDSIQGQSSGATATIATVTEPTYDPRNPAASPKSSYTAILAAVNALIGPIDSLPNIDDSNYFEALEFITKFGLAQTISSLAKEDLYSRFLFVEVNATEALKQEIVELLLEEEVAEEASSLPLIGPEGELIEQ
jgi:hypothetical protein